MENIKNTISLTLSLFYEISDAMKDGKVNFWEGLGLIPEVKDFASIVDNVPQAIQEFKTLNSEQMQELFEYFQKKYNFTQSETGIKIQESVEFVISAYRLYTLFKKG